MDNSSSSAPLLEGVHKLINAIKPSKFTNAEKRSRASLLKSILSGVADYCESHAVSHKPGLARALFTEISGHAGLPIFRRFNAALTAALNAAAGASKPVAAAVGVASAPCRDGGGNRRLSYNKPKEGGEPKDIASVMCYGCRSFGHYRNRCPNRGLDKNNNN